MASKFMFCPNCDAEVDAGAASCLHCRFHFSDLRGANISGPELPGSNNLHRGVRGRVMARIWVSILLLPLVWLGTLFVWGSNEITFFVYFVMVCWVLLPLLPLPARK